MQAEVQVLSLESKPGPVDGLDLVLDEPWVRSLGSMGMEVRAEGWRFPQSFPEDLTTSRPRSSLEPCRRNPNQAPQTTRTRLQPPRDAVTLQERLLYLLQPSLEQIFSGKEIELPFQPYPYQLQGIAFLMPRHAALLADEMGLGKTMQSIVALRLLFHAGLIRRALIVCPKALLHNWFRELRLWAKEVPCEVISGDTQARRSSWLVSNCPLKLVNYELLTRDAEFVEQEDITFDVVLLDEAQRIKNRDSRTAQVVRTIRRKRSWALTGTPVENRSEDLINLFAFVNPGQVPSGTPPKQLPALIGDCLLRRRKEDVLTELPDKIIRDAYVELTAEQRDSYDLVEKEGIVRLNAIGDTITVQHVFELIMRLKQICNFDPMTGASAKLEQLESDLAEVAASGRKALVFSQWIEPLTILADRLAELGTLQFHGRMPAGPRAQILTQFREDPRKHVLFMSYGTGSVGLNLQCANYVFLFDRWWNPAVEDQAINRTHRIGQRDPVFVTRFVTENTIEGRICEVLEKKRELFRDLIEHQSGPAAWLTEADIFGLFGLRVRPRQLAA
jgi:SNF2 family DNA or RNA helicase